MFGLDGEDSDQSGGMDIDMATRGTTSHIKPFEIPKEGRAPNRVSHTGVGIGTESGGMQRHRGLTAVVQHPLRTDSLRGFDTQARAPSVKSEGVAPRLRADSTGRKKRITSEPYEPKFCPRAHYRLMPWPTKTTV